MKYLKYFNKTMATYSITTLVENCVYNRKLEADHGWSFHTGIVIIPADFGLFWQRMTGQLSFVSGMP